jgi:hypothetical protein
MGLVGDLSGRACRDELVALLGEEEVAGALASLDQLGLAGAVHPALDCGPASVHLVERLDRAPAAHAPELPPWRGRLAAIARGIPGGELDEWLERLRVRRRDARVVASAAVVPPRLAGALTETAEPARIAELLAPHPAEVALMVVALEGPAAESPSCTWRSCATCGWTSTGHAAGAAGDGGVAAGGRAPGRAAAAPPKRRAGGREEQLEAARELLAEVAG